MTIEAELADGTILEFPDGTPQGVIQAAVKRMVLGADSAALPAQTLQKEDKPWASGLEIANIAGGVLEPITKMATGFVAKPVGEIAGMVSGAADVLSGGRLGGRNASEVSQDIQKAMTYEPKTQAGRSSINPLNFIPETIGAGIQAVANPVANAVTGENADPSSFRKMAGDAVREAIPQAANIGMVKAFPMPKTPAELAAKSFQDAARIDAAKMAVEKYGLSLDPVISNPTKMNALRATAAGQDHLLALLRRENEPKVAMILKDDLGIPKTTALDSVAPFEAVREAAGGAKRKIQTMAGFADDGTTATTISALQPEALIGGKAAQKKVGRMIEDANNLLSSNVHGGRLIAEIENLRKTARDIYKGTDIKPTQRAVADASMGIANALEGMIERNLQTLGMDDLLTQFRDGRVKMAKSYTLQEATNLNTGLVDPLIIAKMTSKDNALSGAFADVGKIAGNFPEALGIKPGAPGGFKELAATHMTRTGAGGMTGYVVGGMFGQPLLGAGIGAGLGELGGSLYAKRLATNPKVQQAVSIPKDYRMLTGGTP
jgi:hypothetical protein